MPSPTAFCEATDVQAWLRVNGLDAGDDTFVAALITEVTGLFQQELGWGYFEATFTNERYDGNDATSIFVRYPPLSAVTSVKVNGAVIPAAADPAGAGWLIGGDAALGEIALVGGARFPFGTLNVEISYTGGYATIPGHIRQAAAKQTAYLYRGRTRIGENSKTLGAGSQAQFETDALLPEVQQILSKAAQVVHPW